MAKKRKPAASESDSSKSSSQSQNDFEEKQGAGAQSAPEVQLSRKLQVVFSCLILLQLLAVIAEPFRFFTLSSRGTSPAADIPRETLAPYVEFTYLDHGYFFFAPEPGPSHLIEATFDEGGRESSVRYPDRRAQWPRLLYHRHFMLTENLHQLWAPPIDPELAENKNRDAEQQRLFENWTRDRLRFESMRDSMAKHLAERFNAEDVRIQRIEHRLPSDTEVLVDRMRLNDRRFYLYLPDAAPEQPVAPMDAADREGLPGIASDSPIELGTREAIPADEGSQ